MSAFTPGGKEKKELFQRESIGDLATFFPGCDCLCRPKLRGPCSLSGETPLSWIKGVEMLVDERDGGGSVRLGSRRHFFFIYMEQPLLNSIFHFYQICFPHTSGLYRHLLVWSALDMT